jgi:hypothetical protein
MPALSAAHALPSLLSLLHLLLLLLLARSLSRLLRQLQRAEQHAAPAAATATGAAGGGRPATAATVTASPRPTVATLAPEALVKDFRAAVEWEPYTVKELGVIARMQAWAAESGGLAALPHDILAVFVRGYAYRVDWAEASYAYLTRTLEWRAAKGIDGLMLARDEALPGGSSRRALFERYVQSGVIGEDAEGHPVLLDRMCHTPPAELMGAFPLEDCIAQLSCGIPTPRQNPATKPCPPALVRHPNPDRRRTRERAELS